MPVWSRGQYTTLASFDRFWWINLSAQTASWFTTWTTTPEESAHLRLDYADVPLLPPCFTITHLETTPKVPGQAMQRIVSPGGSVGEYKRHLSEIDCWHTRYTLTGTTSGALNVSWPSQLRDLRDMVAYLATSGTRTTPLLDFNSATASPFTTAGLIRFTDLREVAVPPDPNPAFMRRRLLLSWESMETVG